MRGLVFFLCVLACSWGAMQYRPYDGVVPLSRVQMPATYSEDTMAYGPNARTISNSMAQNSAANSLSSNGVNLLHTYWGLLVSNDMVRVINNDTDVAPIPANDTGDVDAAYYGWKTPTPQLPFWRVAAAPGTGKGTGVPKRGVMYNTMWLDASHIYGNNQSEATPRWDPSTGELYFFPDADGLQLFSLGASYVRLLQLEHNRLVSISNQTDPYLKYQDARRLVIGIVQSITTREYLATLTGTPLTPYAGYNASVDPSVDHFFAAVALRYGHSAVTSYIPFLAPDLTPSPVGGTGIPEIVDTPISAHADFFRGVSNNLCGEVDPGVIYDLRNSPINPSKTSFDILATNIMRGRDYGLPDYNSARAYLGLPKVTSFEEITNSSAILSLLKTYYATVDDIDPYVGALAEERLVGAHVGALMSASIRDQFLRARDGDQFWYENTFTEDEIQWVHGRKLSDLMLDNLNISNVGNPTTPFFTSERQLGNIGGNIFPEPMDHPKGLPWQSRVFSPAYKMLWAIDSSDDSITIQLIVRTDGWVGIGFAPDQINTMKGADIIFCGASSTVPPSCIDSKALDVGLPTNDDLLNGGVQSLTYNEVQRQSGFTFALFTRAIDTKDTAGDNIITDNQRIIFAFNPITDEPVYHGPTRNSSVVINWLSDYVPSQGTNLGLVIGLPVGLGVAAIFLIILGICALLYYNSGLDLSPLPAPVRWQYEQYQQNKSSKWENFNNQFYCKTLEPKGAEYDNMLQLLSWLDWDDKLKIAKALAIYNPILISSFMNYYQILKRRLEASPERFGKKDWEKKPKKLEKRKIVFDFYTKRNESLSWNKGELVPILPAVHGTGYKISLAICSTGFASLSSLDSGWYGKGIYFTTFISYALPYLATKADPSLIISFVIPGNIYPTTERPSAKSNLVGAVTQNGYTSHYVCVQADGLPPAYKEIGNSAPPPLYDEIVIPQESQITPVYVLQLAPDTAMRAFKRFQKKVSSAALLSSSKVNRKRQTTERETIQLESSRQG